MRNIIFHLTKKGQLPVYIAFFGVLIIGLALIWVYIQNQDSFGQTFLSNLPFLTQKKVINTNDWKVYSPQDQNLLIYYPPNWYLSDEGYISQFPYSPYSHDISNAINVATVNSQLQTSYANEDWFAHLYEAKNNSTVSNEYHSTDQNQFKKLNSGKTVVGKKFVLFQTTAEPSRVYAYLMINRNRIYLFTLQQYNDQGKDFFIQILTAIKST